MCSVGQVVAVVYNLSFGCLDDPVGKVQRQYRILILLFTGAPLPCRSRIADVIMACDILLQQRKDRKSTRLNSSHVSISYAVSCSKKNNAWHSSEGQVLAVEWAPG